MPGSFTTEEDGFTLVEVMIAATVLLVGLVGVTLMLTHAATATWSTKAREQGVSLQRELVENTRAIPYDQLSGVTLASRIQALPAAGLADSSPSPGWTIRRRGFTYAVSVGVCSVDDPSDGSGTHDGAAFCATGAGAATPDQCSTLLGIDAGIQGTAAAATASVNVGDCGIDLNLDGTVDKLTEASVGICLLFCPPPAGTSDPTPEDYKRIVVLVRWDRGTGRRYALQSSTISNPGASSAPAVVTLTTSAADPITSGSTAAFTATTNRAANNVAWSVDGTQRGAASGSGTNWTFSWGLGTVSAGSAPSAGEVLDGSYVVGAKAFDSYGAYGQTRSLTLRLNRRAPYAPTRFEAGRNGSAVDFEWSANAERDIKGYRVYRDPLVGADVQVCALTTATSCRDASPPAGSLTYYVVAVDTTTAGALREGLQSAGDTVGVTNTPPSPPSGLTASTSGANTILIWSASPGDPDLGDSVDHYRIYRDGTTYEDRYDRTSTGSDLTFTDTKTNGLQHTYRVVAVDQNLAESTMIGPVTR
jgi:prepilin-type N-terminal cleavage/methylation domain-containing protein